MIEKIISLDSTSPKKKMGYSKDPSIGYNNKKSFTNNKDKFNFDDKNDFDKQVSKEWKSGYMFNSKGRKQQRNDPWWMRYKFKNQYSS